MKSDPREVAPADDVGARTADLYHWQAAMAAADGLVLLTRLLASGWTRASGGDNCIICEHHEDWMIQVEGNFELVSAKHREAASGPWTTVNSLIADGGIGHLFARWLSLRQVTTSRLVSSAAASKTAAEFVRCTDLARQSASGPALSEEDSALLTKTTEASIRAIMRYGKILPPEWCAPEGAKGGSIEVSQQQRETFQAFLRTLVCDLSRPDRELIRHAAANMYALPLVMELRQPPALAPIVWEGVLPLFEKRMRARGPGSFPGAPVVAPSVTGWPTPESKLEPKTLDLRDLLVAVESIIANPIAYAPLVPPATASKLSMKLAQGGCTETSIARAERLRMDYRRYRREREKNVPGSRAERGRLERALHRVADEESHAAISLEGRWGSALWRALSTRLQSEGLDHLSADLDGDLALGGISELTARCEIWFSTRFDVEAAIKSHLASRSTL